MSGGGEVVGGDSSVLTGLSSQFRERADRVFGTLPKPPCVRRDQLAPAEESSSSAYVGELKYRGRVHRVYFKTPARAKHGTRYTPDYMKHPERWTKYDLKEDGTESMKNVSADQVNKVAAFQFLQKRRGSFESETTLLTEEKLTFKKPKNKKLVTPILTKSTRSSAGNAHVMPEYEVGEKREYNKKVHSGQTSSCPSVKLSHLEEDD